MQSGWSFADVVEEDPLTAMYRFVNKPEQYDYVCEHTFLKYYEREDEHHSWVKITESDARLALCEFACRCTDKTIEMILQKDICIEEYFQNAARETRRWMQGSISDEELVNIHSNMRYRFIGGCPRWQCMAHRNAMYACRRCVSGSNFRESFSTHHYVAFFVSNEAADCAGWIASRYITNQRQIMSRTGTFRSGYDDNMEWQRKTLTTLLMRWLDGATIEELINT